MTKLREVADAVLEELQSPDAFTSGALVELSLTPRLPDGSSTREDREKLRMFVTPISVARTPRDRGTDELECTIDVGCAGYTERYASDVVIDLADSVTRYFNRRKLTLAGGDSARCTQTTHQVLYSPQILEQHGVTFSLARLVIKTTEDVST